MWSWLAREPTFEAKRIRPRVIRFDLIQELVRNELDRSGIRTSARNAVCESASCPPSGWVARTRPSPGACPGNLVQLLVISAVICEATTPVPDQVVAGDVFLVG